MTDTIRILDPSMVYKDNEFTIDTDVTRTFSSCYKYSTTSFTKYFQENNITL